MFFTKIVSLAATAAMVAAHDFTETIEGFKFVKSGPKELKPKIDYEWYGAQHALDAFRKHLGPDEMLTLLADDIAKADDYWHGVVNKSTGAWVPTDGFVTAFLPNLTAFEYAAWMRTPLWDAANNLANPEHYFKRTVEISSGVLQSEILEGWGGVITLFDIPTLGLPDRKAYPFLREQKDFPLQVAGPKVLKDGTTFGVLHISARDVPKPKGKGGKSTGVEVRATVWYPDGVEDAHIEIERQHITTEIINTALECQKQILDGTFTPPPPPASA